MGLFSRLADIIDANLNVMLERADDPERLIGLVIQEMEDTLVDVRAQTVRAMAYRKELASRCRDIDFDLLEWDRKAELAVAKGRDDLARGALVAKARLLESVAPLRQEIQLIDDGMAKGAEDVSRLEAKLMDAKARQAGLAARHWSATNRLRVKTQLYDGRIDDALTRFGSLERELDHLESRADVMELGRVPAGSPDALSAQIDALAGDDAISAELRAFKTRVAAREGAPKPPPAPGESDPA